MSEQASQMPPAWSMRRTPTPLSPASSLPVIMVMWSGARAELWTSHPGHAMLPPAPGQGRAGLAEPWETLG